MFLCVCLCVFLRVCVRVYVYICIYIHMYICIYAKVHIYTHTHTYIVCRCHIPGNCAYKPQRLVRSRMRSLPCLVHACDITYVNKRPTCEQTGAMAFSIRYTVCYLALSCLTWVMGVWHMNAGTDRSDGVVIYDTLCHFSFTCVTWLRRMAGEWAHRRDRWCCW